MRIIFIFLIISSLVKTSTTQSVYKPTDYQEITKPEFKDTEVFQIIFYSHAGEEGHFPHAYVGFLCFQKCYGNEQFQVFGFYPTVDAEKGIQWIYKYFPGEFINDMDKKPDYAFAVNIGQTEYFAAIEKLEENRISETLEYNAAVQNCLAFVKEIASTIRLNAPPEILSTPNEYISLLYKMNNQ